MIANCFISHTHFQAYIATQVIQRHPDFSGGHNILVSPKERLYTDHEPWSNIVTPPMSLYSNTSYIGISESVELIESLIEEMLHYRRARFLVSNLWSPLNRIASSLVRKHKTIEFCTYPEGLANLMIPKVHGFAMMKEIGKTIILNLQRVPYRYTRDICGVYRADRIYTFNVDLMLAMGIVKERLHKVGFDNTAGLHELDSKRCLIIGQGCDGDLSEEEQVSIRSMLDEIIVDTGCSKIYLKEHPISGKMDRSLQTNKGGEVVSGGGIVEELVGELQCGLVISLYSSALFNLKLMYGDKIRCVSLCGDLALSRHYMYGDEWMGRYKDVCDAFGVELRR